MSFDMNLVKEAFKDAETQEKVIGLFRKFEASIKSTVEDQIEDLRADKNEVVPRSRMSRQMDKAYRYLNHLWRNNGRVDEFTEPKSVEDIFKLDYDFRNKFMADGVTHSTDLPLMMPKVITQQVREAIEPALNLTPLFQTIRYPGRGQTISFPSTGALYAAEIAEGQAYPRQNIELAGSVTATVGKYGVAASITEEAVRYSMFDVIAMHIRAAGRAMARKKEEEAYDALNRNATILLSNDSTSYKSTTGRNATGAYNGTMTVYDFLYAWSQLYNTAGYVPNTLIMNPFGWLAFAQDPLMRQFFMNNGSGRLMQLPQGAPGRASQWKQGGLLTQSTPDTPKAIATSYTDPPEMWPGNVQVIVSPFVSFTDADNTTDIFIVDRNEVGVHVIDEDLMTDRWDDPSVDISHMKFRERYAFESMNDGKAIGKLQGVSIARSYDFDDKISVAYDATPFTGSSSANRLTLDDHLSTVSYSGSVP